MTHKLWRDTRVSSYGYGSEGRAEPWTGLKQVVLVRIEREYYTKPDSPVIIEDHYYLTSLSPQQKDGDPDKMLNYIREHWDIENRLHHVKDRSMGEDASRTKKAAQIYCWLRNLAVTLMVFIPGNSAPQKAINVAAKPTQVVRLLKAKRLKRCKRNF